MTTPELRDALNCYRAALKGIEIPDGCDVIHILILPPQGDLRDRRYETVGSVSQGETHAILNHLADASSVLRKPNTKRN